MSRYIAKKIGPLRARPLSHAAATIIFQCRISSDLRWRMTPPVDLDPIPFDPVPTAARHDGWTPARQRDFIAALRHWRPARRDSAATLAAFLGSSDFAGDVP